MATGAPATSEPAMPPPVVRAGRARAPQPNERCAALLHSRRGSQPMAVFTVASFAFFAGIVAGVVVVIAAQLIVHVTMGD
jgi:hypothetical protein